jgi:N-acetylmuramoyl-L-alanine amidase
MRLFIKLLFLLFAAVLYPQQITYIQFENDGNSSRIPVYKREQMHYTGIKALAGVLSINYLTVSDEKLILKGVSYDVAISSKNPFYIVKDKKGKTIKVHQIPTSTYRIEDDIYIPLAYSLSFINEIFDKEIYYDAQRMVLWTGSSLVTEVKLPVDLSGDPGRTYDISSINIDERANGTLIKISSSKRVRFYNSSYNDGVLTVILRGVNSDPSITDRIALPSLIRQMEILNIGEDSELRFYVTSDYSASELLNAEGGNDLLITLHNRMFSGRDQNKLKEKWDFDVIVIDAGHGGKDAGAIAVNGMKEKDINLAIALKLGNMIEDRLPGIKVEYTRKDDSFVELYKRGKIANEKNGKLFISIHCNSTANKRSNASGFEVYLLRPGRTQEAIGIAEMENSVIQYEDNPDRYQKLTDENFILVSMAHSAYMKYSEKFSEYLDKHFSSGFGLPNRGVKQAGFYVLVGASMPGVLIESGFLSNKKDADYLKSSKGQEKTAELIFESIKSYKGYYESFLGLEK